MVILMCKCLNIRIHSKGSELTTLDLSTLNLNNEQLNESFFQDGVASVILDLAGITKEVACLTRVRNLGEWNLHSCLCCGQDTHALHAEQGFDNVLVSVVLEHDPAAISKAMQLENYSQLYKIILPLKLDNGHETTNNLGLNLHTHQSEALETAISCLQQQLTKFLQKEQEIMEERIRIFIDEEDKKFNSLQDRIRRDKQVITSLLLEAEEHDLRNSITEAMLDTPGLTPPMTPVSNNNQNGGSLMNSLNSEEQDHVEEQIPKQTFTRPRPQSFTSFRRLLMRRKQLPVAPPKLGMDSVYVTSSQGHGPLPIDTCGLPNSLDKRPLMLRSSKMPLRKMAVVNPPRIAQSLDTDGIFDLDGVEDGEVAPFYHSDDEIDTDDSTSNDDVFKPVSGLKQYASSVPILAPAWMQNHHSSEDSDEERVVLPEDPAQMAASIKALAQSVHRNDCTQMFGELPRPRLNTLD